MDVVSPFETCINDYRIKLRHIMSFDILRTLNSLIVVLRVGIECSSVRLTSTSGEPLGTCRAGLLSSGARRCVLWWTSTDV
jgi:hypothetical protein